MSTCQNCSQHYYVSRGYDEYYCSSSCQLEYTTRNPDGIRLKQLLDEIKNVEQRLKSEMGKLDNKLDKALQYCIASNDKINVLAEIISSTIEKNQEQEHNLKV